MKRRIGIIEENSPDVTVSIHQNSYPEEYVHGAQVFYYTGSEEGKALAEKSRGVWWKAWIRKIKDRSRQTTAITC